MLIDGLGESELKAVLDSNPALAQALLKKLQAEAGAGTETREYVKALFGEQYRFFADPAKKKTALCGRRSGKTEAVAAWLLDGAEDDPRGMSVYIALSRNNCRQIMWRTMEDLKARYDLDLTFREIDNQLYVFTSNGHRIWLAGCKDSREIDKFRGNKYRRVVIDEGASYGGYLKQLVEDALEPALLDLNGELAIIGTPGIVPSGYFFEITSEGTGPGSEKAWPTYHWTCESNPYIQLRDLPEEARAEELARANSDRTYINERSVAYLEKKLEDSGWPADHPTYLREWKGLWVRDEGALVYKVEDKNLYTSRHPLGIPAGTEGDKWRFAIGSDVGYEDDTAFVVGAYRKGHPEIYLVHAESHGHLIPSAVAARLEVLQKKYKAYEIVMDTGGIGKGYAEECIQRYGIFVEAAQKTRKRAFIEVFRGELSSGNIKINASGCRGLLEDYQRLVWNETQSDVDDRFPDHRPDAALYLVRKLIPYYRPELVHAELSETEKAQQKHNEHRLATMRRAMSAKRRRMRDREAMRVFTSGGY